MPDADVVMDRAFDLPAPPEQVWPWFLQLGKKRAGWYFPRWVERFEPPSRRGLRRLDPALVDEVHVGHVIPDWGGRDATFEVAILEPPHALVHTTQRGRTAGSWAIVLTPYAGRPVAPTSSSGCGSRPSSDPGWPTASVRRSTPRPSPAWPPASASASPHPQSRGSP